MLHKNLWEQQRFPCLQKTYKTKITFSKPQNKKCSLIFICRAQESAMLSLSETKTVVEGFMVWKSRIYWKDFAGFTLKNSISRNYSSFRVYKLGSKAFLVSTIHIFKSIAFWHISTFIDWHPYPKIFESNPLINYSIKIYKITSHKGLLHMRYEFSFC